MDPELAALMAGLEGGTTPTEEPAAEAAPDEPAEPPAEAPAEEPFDAELAAMMAELGGGDEAAAAAPATDQADTSAQIEALGGTAALEDLGWPVFVPSFAEDIGRQLQILQNGSRNKAVEKAVADLVKKCGGYEAVAEHGITPDQGLNAQLAALRQVKQQRDLNDPEVQAMARAYGANLRLPKTDEDKFNLLSQLRDFDKWASDPRNLDAVNALDGTRFAERRQVQLEQEFAKLGGDSALDEWLTDHPLDAVSTTTLESKVALLKGLREYKFLGGDAAYLQDAAGSTGGEDALAAKLEKLKAIRAAGT
jgi:hypothetical protein